MSAPAGSLLTAVAVHEAGHVVAGRAAGYTPDSVTVCGQGGHVAWLRGHCAANFDHARRVLTHGCPASLSADDRAFKACAFRLNLVVAVAGMVAEALFAERQGGSEGLAMCRNHISNEIRSRPLEDDPSDTLDIPKACLLGRAAGIVMGQSFLDEIQQAEGEATRILTDRWAVVREIALHLSQSSTSRLEGEELAALVGPQMRDSGFVDDWAMRQPQRS